jgi:RimJ/RimL family protein N-acetyltransferase
MKTRETTADRTLVSPRLHLEPLEARHADLLFDLLGDETIYTFVPGDPPASLDALRARYERLAVRRSPDAREIWLNWAVRLGETGPYVGTVQATVRDDATALLAYELGVAYRGAGYATEACRAVLDELVAAYGIAHVRAFVDTRNERSVRLLERLGFAREALVEHADFFKGASSDEYVYAWAPAARRAG